jgi:general secretion pathway protein G
MRTFKKGFTLIELLVVIAIIGILAGIVLASLSSSRVGAADAKRISEVRQIQYALDLYYNANGKYPCALYTGGACVNASTLQGGLGGMPRVPKDPSGAQYTYVGLGSGVNCTSYHLGTSLVTNTNQVLRGDKDAAATTVCTNGGIDFSGLSAAAGGAVCSATAGTAQPSGTETCYDVKP